MRENYAIEICYTHFPLHPETPSAGLTLEELFAGRGIDMAAMHAQMLQRMTEEGLPYGERTQTFNSRLAQELATWAAGQPQGDRIHDALYRAYFVEGLNLGKLEVLLEIVDRLGLSRAEARDVLQSRTYQQAVDVQWQRCRALGITGVPTFVVGQRALVGAQPYTALEQLILDVDQ